MKTVFKKLFIIALIIPSLALSNNGKKKWKHTEEKKYNKEFTVNANAKLEIDNQFGNVDVTSWDQNKVKIDVLITVDGNNLEKVKEQIKNITVEFENSSSLVKAITKIGKKKWGWRQNDKSSFQINYTVKVPKSNSVKLTNNYGNISLDEINGKATINCDYGTMTLGDLNASGNEIRSDYSSGSSINYIKSGSVNADYSEITIHKSENLSVNADYTQTAIGATQNLNYNCDYGGIKIDSGVNIKGNGDYVNMKIGELTGNLDIDSAYGDISVDNMKATNATINIDSDYTGVTLGYNSGFSFNFDIETDFGEINLSNNATITIKEKEITSKHYKGHVGSSNSGNTITIESSFGSVSILE